MTMRVIAATVLLGIAVTVVLAGQTPQDATKQESGKLQPTDPPGQKKDSQVTEEPRGFTVKDQLTNADPFDLIRMGSHHKVHILKMIPGYSYTIRMDTPQFDAYLRLEDSKGAQLAEDDDSGGNLNAKIVFNPSQAENYRIIATTFGGGMSGFYTLSVTPTRSAAGTKAATGTKKAVLNVNGELAKGDSLDKIRKGCHAKIFNVKMVAGRNYQINMSSEQFDSYLRLEDSKGNQVAQDDDSGGNQNARISYRPGGTDTFRIIATTFGEGQTGNFNLRVTEE